MNHSLAFWRVVERAFPAYKQGRAELRSYGVAELRTIKRFGDKYPANHRHRQNQSTGQPPTSPVEVHISLKVEPNSGGHEHGDSARPRGGIANVGTCSSDATCWSKTSPANNGVVVFNFNAPEAAGTHTISATCDGCSNTETKSVDVKVPNLISIPASTEYALTDSAGRVIGAVPGKHTKNHYLTSTSISKLNKLVDVYEGVNPGATLYLNDASLEWGGLFDVGSTPWKAPHSTHDRGRSLDIRAANSGPNSEGAVPAAFFEDFPDKAHKKGLRLGLHCKNSSDTNYCLGQPNNRHFHIDF